MKKVSLIVCADSENGIGKQNKLAWSLQEDIKHFKKTTINNVVIMGRKTWNSIPLKFKPLSNRLNIVITTQNKCNFPENPNLIICNSPQKALLHASKYNKEIFVIGGAQIYEQFRNHANKLYLTRIFYNFNADVKFNISDLVNSGQKIYSILGTDTDRFSGQKVSYEICIYELNQV